MKKTPLLLRLIPALLCTGLIIFSYAYAQETAEKNSFNKKYPVTKGIINIDNIRYPVYMRVNTVQKNNSLGIRYQIPVKDLKTGKDLANKIYNFYTLKKINNVVVSKFSRLDKTDTIAWLSKKCEKTTEDGVLILIKIKNNSVVVHIIPSCDDSILENIL